MHFLYTAIKIFFAVILVFVFIAGGSFIIFTFGKSSFDTTSFTNAGFAIFAGCASVCFSWARNLEDRAMDNKITMYGEGLFLSALCFVIASLLKYILIHKATLLNEHVISSVSLIFPVLNVFGAIMFLLAYLTAWGAIIGLMRILFRNAFLGRGT
jgi:hypothetical protein